jgi:hypothetical protein
VTDWSERQPVTALRACAAALVAAVLSTAPFAGSPASPEAAARLRDIMERVRSSPAQPSSPAEARDRMQERTRLLAEGEGALARLEVEGALRSFEQAAALAHAADTELGLVRTYMQGGEYRRAVAFVAHTATAHRDQPGGAALYAWLLKSGGYPDQALRMLKEAEQRFPGDPLLQRVRQLLGAGTAPDGSLLDPPARLAPYGPATLPAAARVAGSAVLLDGGRALVPASSLKAGSRFWVRDGLGRLAQATPERGGTANGVVTLRLKPELPPLTYPVAPRDAFPGSPAFLVEYVAAPTPHPAWPLLSSGFLGAAAGSGGDRELGLDVAAGPRGGPVFDAAGRFIGMALPAGKGPGVLVPASRLVLRPQPNAKQDVAVGRVSVDEIYERALRVSLQLISAP